MSNLSSGIRGEICYNEQPLRDKQREHETSPQPPVLAERIDQEYTGNNKCNKFDKHFSTVSDFTDGELTHRKFQSECNDASRHSSCTVTYKRDMCHKTFTYSSSVSGHKQIHSGIKKHECDVCNITFTQFSGLSQHKQIHSGIKNYECDVCHKTFIYSSSLSRHKHIHAVSYTHLDVYKRQV